jgi:hypothetical protein
VRPLRLVPLLRVLHQAQDQVLRELHDETHGDLPQLSSSLSRRSICVCVRVLPPPRSPSASRG